MRSCRHDCLFPQLRLILKILSYEKAREVTKSGLLKVFSSIFVHFRGHTKQGIALAAALLAAVSAAQADPGHPVAVRWWGQAMVSIETQWNLRVVIDPCDGKIGYQDPGVSADLVLVTHEHGDHNNVDLVGGEPTVVRGLNENGQVQAIDHVLDRMPNQDNLTWRDAKLRIARTPNAIKVSSIPAWHDDTQGSQRGANAMFVVEVDGVRIVHCGDLGQPKLTSEQLERLGEVDVLLIPVGGVYTVDGTQAGEIVSQIKPRIVVPIHYKTPNLVYDLQPAVVFLDAVKDSCDVVRTKGNTLAVRQQEKQQGKSQVVVLDFMPMTLSEEVEQLVQAKEEACRKSQQVFAQLSANQLNFRPSNGTHTPRWNAEHMMGRELGFFSKIYSKLDPAIPHMDLNPKQMPPDYEAAHPQWDGEEEARQMQRVSAFTRRYAYLLNELPLDKPAPGSRWTPRKLLEVMEWHYGDHTANVQKKFELPEWPSE